MANLSDLEIRLSGGASNTTPITSLGGAMSTVSGGLVDSQTPSGITTITGVVMDNAAGNAEGSGSLFFDFSETKLRWTPPGGTAGTAVLVDTNGTYALQGGNSGGILFVTVTAASLPSADQTNSIAIVNIANNLFDDVTKVQSRDGITEFRCVMIKNKHSTDTIVDIKVWIASNTPGQDVISIALDTVSKNTAATVASDEIDSTDALGTASVDFDGANPVDAASALTIVDLSAGDYFPIWIRRTVPAGVTAAEANNTFKLAIRASV